MNEENIELKRGRKEYESKIKNLEGIFDKLQKVLNITEYKKEFNQIKNDVNNDSSLSNEMISLQMQLDYEDYSLKPYIDRLDNLLKNIEDELLPFYELHLLTSKINIEISEVTCDNIHNIINDTKTLIDQVNSLHTHDIKEKNNLIEGAYKTIYSVIMYEEIFERQDILTYINYLNIDVNRENIGRLLSNDLNSLSEKDLIEEDLRTIKTEGLGYDYLNPDIIRKISRKTVGETNSEYQERKRQAIEDITSKVNNFKSQKDTITEELNDNKTMIRMLNLKKSLLISKVLSLVLIPVITISAGNYIGQKSSNKITEYKTITRTIDLNSGKIIGEPTEVYDENETTYVATILVCSPWRANPTGVGYIRSFTAYEYIVPDNIPDDYHITREDLEGNMREKYKYDEPKDVLTKDDSTTDYSILITETYQDKSQTRKSTKFIIPFTLLGAGLGILIDVLLMLLKVYGLQEIGEKLERLNDEINEEKLNNEEIKERLKQMKEEASLLQDEYNEVVKKYGSLGDQLIISDIDSLGIPFAKKKIKK